MDAFDESLLTESEGEDDKNAMALATREQLIFLVMAHEDLLVQTALEDEEFEGLTWLEVTCRVIAAILRQKVIASSGDEVACIFFNTLHSGGTIGAGDSTFVLQDLGQVDVARIKQLELFDVPAFLSDIGVADPRQSETGVGLKNALWQANLLFGSVKGARVARRLVVFAPDAPPAAPGTQIWKGLLRNAEELAAKQATLQVIPLLLPESKFSQAAQWKPIFAQMESVNASSPQKSDMAANVEQFGRLQDLKSTVRAKSHQQRSLGQYRLVLGPDVVAAVSMFATLQPATKGQAQWVHAVTNAPLTINSALIDNDTGTALGDLQRPEQQVPKLFFPNTKDAHFKHANFPKVYLEPREMRRVKHSTPRTISILGFKRASCLKDSHQLRSSSFLYPDERGIVGSTKLFIALHGAMLEKDQIAVASFGRTSAEGQRLVALLPQEEQCDEEGNQVAPPGLHVIYLPFADDLRQPESDTAFTGILTACPSAEQVAAADALISHLQLGEFYSDSIANPHLQRHYQVLEALALGEEPDQEIMDDTLPDEDSFKAIASVIRAFKEAVTGPMPAPSPASKRKVGHGTSIPRHDDDDEEESVKAVQAALLEGALDHLPVATLKPWLKRQGLHISGKKAELVQRIVEHAAGAGGA